MLDVKSDEWIVNTIQAANLPDGIDYYGWDEAQKEIMIELFLSSQDKDIQHDVMCEISGHMMEFDISPIGDTVKYGAKLAEILIEYLGGFVSGMMFDYDSQQVERD